MPSPRYNLRNKQPHNYRERQLVDEDSSEEDINHSHRSPDTSRFSSSDTTSALSTSSNSFSYHSGSSPSARQEPEHSRLYPDLSQLDDSLSPRKRSSVSPEVNRRSKQRGGGDAGRSRSDRVKDDSSQQPSPQPRTKPEKRAETSESWWKSVLAVVAIIVALSVMVVSKLTSPAPSSVPDGEVDRFDQFCSQVDVLKERFPGQTQRFWKVIKACSRHVFDPDLATYPAVVLMVGEKRQSSLASQIAESVRQTFDSSMSGYSVTDNVSFNLTDWGVDNDANKQKLKLDEWLKDKLDKHTAVVVNHLESLHPEAALLLHGYCDGDNAPYKRAMLLLSLFFDRPVDSDTAAEEALYTLWDSEYMKDKVRALLSRIANNIVLLQPPPFDSNVKR